MQGSKNMRRTVVTTLQPHRQLVKVSTDPPPGLQRKDRMIKNNAHNTSNSNPSVFCRSSPGCNRVGYPSELNAVNLDKIRGILFTTKSTKDTKKNLFSFKLMTLPPNSYRPDVEPIWLPLVNFCRFLNRCPESVPIGEHCLPGTLGPGKTGSLLQSPADHRLPQG